MFPCTVSPAYSSEVHKRALNPHRARMVQVISYVNPFSPAVHDLLPLPTRVAKASERYAGCLALCCGLLVHAGQDYGLRAAGRKLAKLERLVIGLGHLRVRTPNLTEGIDGEVAVVSRLPLPGYCLRDRATTPGCRYLYQQPKVALTFPY